MHHFRVSQFGAKPGYRVHSKDGRPKTQPKGDLLRQCKGVRVLIRIVNFEQNKNRVADGTITYLILQYILYVASDQFSVDMCLVSLLFIRSYSSSRRMELELV